MGYKLPDGRYVDDSGKVHRNYNDALAESRTRQARQQQESFLKRSLNRYSTANEELYGQQQLKNTLGWIPGFGRALDDRMQRLAQVKEDAQAGIIGHSGQLGIYQERMGELPPTKPFEIRSTDIGGDGRGEQYRQQLSQYTPKVFPMTAEGQQERYFGTPELNYVFGSQTGKGPKTAEEMRALGSQATAPTTSPLSDYYRSQSAMGRINQADIQAMYADRPDLQEWAAANPMLAQREFAKQQAAQPTSGPTPFEIMGAMEKGQFYPSEGSPFPMERTTPGVANPVPPTQQPGPGGVDQGTRVSLARGAESIAPQQAEKTSGESMPSFPTTLDKVKNFLGVIGQ